MEIRTLRGGDDLLAVSRVYEESWKAAYRDILPDVYLDSLPAGRWVPYLRQAAGRSLVLIENGRVVGTSSYGPSRAPALAGWGEIISLYLLPDVWGQGYGGQLLTATVRQLKRAGYRSLFLWVLEENRRARAFYERMGFTPCPVHREESIGGRRVRQVQYRYPADPGGRAVQGENWARREAVIRQWFAMWLDKRDTGLRQIFARDAVYIESWGPEYHGSDQIQHWFDEWNTRGTVRRWDIRQFFHRGEQTVVEWQFACDMADGERQAFAGLSLIRWNRSGQICLLQEFGCHEDRYDPYQNGPEPVFRQEPARWF